MGISGVVDDVRSGRPMGRVIVLFWEVDRPCIFWYSTGLSRTRQSRALKRSQTVFEFSALLRNVFLFGFRFE